MVVEIRQHMDHVKKYLSLRNVLSLKKYIFFSFQLMWIYREISAPVLFIWAQIEPDIRWRNNYFRLKWGGLVEPLDRKINLWQKQKNEQVT